MERRLNKAAMNGSVPSLLQLLREDELILDRSISSPNLDTPLHVASMLGHSEFVSKILSLKPELAREVDSQRSTPLHLAAAKGYVDIVKSLLDVYPGACSVHDKYGRNPVQVAAFKGKIDVLELLVKADAAAARSVNNRTGETVLHLCTKNGKLESLMAIVGMFGVDDEFIDWKDKEGNSALHLAAADEQFEIVDFLTNHTRANVNSPNLNGFTAVDFLVQNKIAIKGKGVVPDPSHLNGQVAQQTFAKPKKTKGSSSKQSGAYNWRKHFRRQNSWLERMRTSLMVVATLTATMAFQAGLSPPAGVWQDNPDNSTALSANYTIPFLGQYIPGSTTATHLAGISIMGDTYYGVYLSFLVFNTIGFIASLSIILLLISGLPMRKKFFVVVLMVIMWIVITSMAMTYAISIIFLAPRDQTIPYEIIGLGILAWIALITLLLLLHMIRLMWRALRACFRAMIPRARRRQVIV